MNPGFVSVSKGDPAQAHLSLKIQTNCPAMPVTGRVKSKTYLHICHEEREEQPGRGKGETAIQYPFLVIK